ncbi:MAG: hypothetical protein PVH87_26305 [Desulfobacteraceae bacterium]
MTREPEDLPESMHQRCGMTALDGPLPVSFQAAGGGLRSGGRPLSLPAERGRWCFGGTFRCGCRETNIHSGGRAMYQVFRVPTHHLGPSDQPDYTVSEGLFYPTVSHPRGWSDRPNYELREDGRIYRSSHHPLGAGGEPDYEIGPDCLMYRTDQHPDGRSTLPEYEIREMAV